MKVQQADDPEIDVTKGQAGDMFLGARDQFAATAISDPETANLLDPPKDAASPVSDASGPAAKLVAEARTQLGLPYVYGSKAWGKSLDCSGLTQQAFKRIGINIGGDTYSQVKQGTAVADLEHAQLGDLIFSTGDIGMRRNGHVGIYIGNGQMIVAPHTGAKVRIQAVPKHIDNIRRYI